MSETPVEILLRQYSEQAARLVDSLDVRFRHESVGECRAHELETRIAQAEGLSQCLRDIHLLRRLRGLCARPGIR